MPAYPTYVERVKEQVWRGFQPEGATLFAEVAATAEAFAMCVPEDVRGRRVTAALISFTDDHRQPFPRECFPSAAQALLAELPRHSTIPGVLRSEPCGSQASFLEAVLTAHLALRQAARGRDGRALAGARLTMEERLARGRSIRPFVEGESRGGDPLGDAYHYLATLAAGLVAGSGIRHRWMLPLFAAGPELMWAVREGLMGAPLFYGNHARIDRMGLAHGWRIARR